MFKFLKNNMGWSTKKGEVWTQSTSQPMFLLPTLKAHRVTNQKKSGFFHRGEKLGGGFKYFLFSSLFREDFQFD